MHSGYSKLKQLLSGTQLSLLPHFKVVLTLPGHFPKEIDNSCCMLPQLAFSPHSDSPPSPAILTVCLSASEGSVSSPFSELTPTPGLWNLFYALGPCSTYHLLSNFFLMADFLSAGKHSPISPSHKTALFDFSFFLRYPLFPLI